MSRLEQLESMLAESPNDTFLRYAVAMELSSEEQHERSLAMHQTLMNDEPPYVPSFFMSGQQLADLERIDEAKSIVTEGISHAQTQGDTHAAAEMMQFLDSLD